MTDPWEVRENIKSTDSIPQFDSNAENRNPCEFEDNFAAAAAQQHNNRTNANENDQQSHQILPDSQQYLESLEKKLRRLKRNPNLLQQLSAKREECIRNLLNDSLRIDHDDDLALDAPVATGESAVHEIYRHLRPVQPLNVGETVNIVKYDQLEEQRAVDEASSEDSETASR